MSQMCQPSPWTTAEGSECWSVSTWCSLLQWIDSPMRKRLRRWFFLTTGMMSCRFSQLHRHISGTPSLTIWPFWHPVTTIWSHTYAKLIEIKLLYLQKRHGLHESVGKMESNDTPHGSQFGSLLLWKFSPKFATFLKLKDYLAIFFRNLSPESFTLL